MTEISAVPGIPDSTLELFLAAGYETVEALGRSSVADIVEDLDSANRRRAVPVRLPSESEVLGWKQSARRLARGGAGPGAVAVATEIPRAELEAAGIELDQLPVAELAALKRTAARGPAREGKAGDPKEQPATRPPTAPPETSGRPPATAPEEGAATKAASPPPEARSPAPERRQVRRLERPEAPAEEPTPAQRFRQLEEIQKAKPPGERRNRGMSHPDAKRVRLAATVTVLGLAASTVAGLALAGALVMARFYGWHFDWTISLLLLVFPVTLFLYLGIGTKARCRLCGQRLFVPKNCRKHERAGRSLFGPTFAVARDAMFLARYRCMLCGTKTRLKD